MVLFKLDVTMQRNTNWSVSIILQKIQVQVQVESIDLKRNTDKLNLIEEKEGNRLEYFSEGDTFLDRTQIVRVLRQQLINGTSQNWKAAVRQRTLLIGENSSLQEAKRFCINPIYNRRLILNIFKEFTKVHLNRLQNPNKNGVEA